MASGKGQHLKELQQGLGRGEGAYCSYRFYQKNLQLSILTIQTDYFQEKELDEVAEYTG